MSDREVPKTWLQDSKLCLQFPYSTVPEVTSQILGKFQKHFREMIPTVGFPELTECVCVCFNW